MKKQLRLFVLFLCLSFSSIAANADCASDPAHPCAEFGCNPDCLNDPNNYDPFNTPIDGGASLIVLGGAALGVLGLKKKKANI